MNCSQGFPVMQPESENRISRVRCAFIIYKNLNQKKNPAFKPGKFPSIIPPLIVVHPHKGHQPTFIANPIILLREKRKFDTFAKLSI